MSIYNFSETQTISRRPKSSKHSTRRIRIEINRKNSTNDDLTFIEEWEDCSLSSTNGSRIEKLDV
jgi:hypothetical protein